MNALFAALFRPTPSATAQCRSSFRLQCLAVHRSTSFRTFSNNRPTKYASEVRSKPKESTPLRKTAAASLPLRTKHPSLTPRPIITLATAERYAIPALRRELPTAAILFHDAFWIPSWAPEGGSGDGEIFIFFANGSVVCWGIDPEQADVFVKRYLEARGVAIGSLTENETEDLEFVTDDNESTRLQGDMIVLGRTPPLEDNFVLPNPTTPPALPLSTFPARYAFSQALARSTSLSVLETSLEDYLSSVSLLPESLSTTGKPGLSRIQLIKKLGELLKFRQGLNLNRDNFADVPDFYWAEPVLEGYFNSVSEALEIRSRTALVNEKITYAAEVQSVLRQLLTEKSTHRMELIIIALIAVEAGIALIRDGPDLFELLTGRKTKDQVQFHH